VVRGPASLLAATAVALGYFLLAGDLPSLGGGDAAALVAGVVGATLVATITLGVPQAGDDAFSIALILGGSALLVAGMDAGGARASVTALEALAAGSFGVLLGRALAAPAVALAVPVFVAIIDAYSAATEPASRLANGVPRGAAELTFDLPSWGGVTSAGSRLGLTDAVFMAMFTVWARRFGLRPRATVVGMLCGLLAAVVLSVLLDRSVPALPLIAVGYWVPNVDRFGALLGR
jgi:hypothetical protein